MRAIRLVIIISVLLVSFVYIQKKTTSPERVEGAEARSNIIAEDIIKEYYSVLDGQCKSRIEEILRKEYDRRDLLSLRMIDTNAKVSVSIHKEEIGLHIVEVMQSANKKGIYTLYRIKNRANCQKCHSGDEVGALEIGMLPN
jgi:hypothetical protein